MRVFYLKYDVYIEKVNVASKDQTADCKSDVVLWLIQIAISRTHSFNHDTFKTFIDNFELIICV